MSRASLRDLDSIPGRRGGVRNARPIKSVKSPRDETVQYTTRTGMNLLLVHHAEAVDPGVDSRRPLSTAGLATARRVAAAAAARGFVPDLIRHSGKLRARETAEALWEACGQRAGISAARGLQPGDPTGWMADQLAGETRAIALVGHMPHLPALLARLTGAPRDVLPSFPLHGCVGLAADGDGWREVWRFGATDDAR